MVQVGIDLYGIALHRMEYPVLPSFGLSGLKTQLAWRHLLRHLVFLLALYQSCAILNALFRLRKHFVSIFN